MKKLVVFCIVFWFVVVGGYGIIYYLITDSIDLTLLWVIIATTLVDGGIFYLLLRVVMNKMKFKFEYEESLVPERSDLRGESLVPEGSILGGVDVESLRNGPRKDLPRVEVEKPKSINPSKTKPTPSHSGPMMLADTDPHPLENTEPYRKF